MDERRGGGEVRESRDKEQNQLEKHYMGENRDIVAEDKLEAVPQMHLG